MEMMNLSTLLVIIGLLMAMTNIITEVLKKLTWDKIPTNILVVLIAEGLTLASGIAYWQINSFTMTWYVVAAMFVVGLLVAYAAMFGFDKLKQALEQRVVRANE